MTLSPMQLLIILVIVVLLFGTKKFKNVGKDLGGAVKDFKDAVKTETQEAKEEIKVIDHKSESLPTQNPQSSETQNSSNQSQNHNQNQA